MPIKFSRKGEKPKPDEKKAETPKNSAAHAVVALKKEFGKDFVTSGKEVQEVERIPFGILPLDLATGGGVPCSRVTEIFGPEGGTKSLMLYKLIVSVQKSGKIAVLVQPEHVFDNAWGARCGIDLDKLIVVHPDNGEQAVDAVETFLYSYDVGLVGVDSIASMQPNNLIESEAGKVIVAGNAPLITKLANKAGAALSKERRNGHFPALVGINQLRHRIGVMFGNPEKTPGGFAWHHATTMRLRLYGTNKIIKEVNPSLPTYKEVSGIIHKYRVPIVSQTFKFDIATLEHTITVDDTPYDIAVGDVDGTDTAMEFMESLGLLQKLKKGYQVFELEFKTLKAIEHAYRTDPKFKASVNETIWKTAKEQHSIVQKEVAPEMQAAMEQGE